MKKSKAWILWTLFKSMFVLSSCTFGGGFVIVSLMKKKFVEELQWLDEDEMLDVTAITQSAPGSAARQRVCYNRLQNGGNFRLTFRRFRHNIASYDCTFNHISVL